MPRLQLGQRGVRFGERREIGVRAVHVREPARRSADGDVGLSAPRPVARASPSTDSDRFGLRAQRRLERRDRFRAGRPISISTSPSSSGAGLIGVGQPERRRQLRLGVCAAALQDRRPPRRCRPASRARASAATSRSMMAIAGRRSPSRGSCARCAERLPRPLRELGVAAARRAHADREQLVGVAEVALRAPAARQFAVSIT